MKILRFLIPIFIIGALAIPFVIVVQSVGGLDYFSDSSVSAEDQIYTLFRIAGLEAFLILTFYILFWEFRRILESLFPGISIVRLYFMGWPFVFLFILTHPILFALYNATVSQKISEGLMVFVPKFFQGTDEWIMNLGRLAIYGLFLTALASLLRKKFVRWNLEKKIPILNYIIFILVVFHSQNIGTDASAVVFRSITLFAVGLVMIGIMYRAVARMKF